MKRDPQPPDHPLVGLWFHSLKDDLQTIEWQGHVRAVDGDVVIVQLYEWIGGFPSRIEKVSKAQLYSDRFWLYPTSEHMVIAYERQYAGRAR